MVSAKVVSRYSEGFPGADAPVKKIAGGPLYPSSEVMALLEDGEGKHISPWTRKCIADIQSRCIANDDLCGLLLEAITKGTYLDSEWCEQKTDGPWAACDSYRLTRREWIDVVSKNMDIGYFFKFAIGKTGKILLLVSCHPS